MSADPPRTVDDDIADAITNMENAVRAAGNALDHLRSAAEHRGVGRVGDLYNARRCASTAGATSEAAWRFVVRSIPMAGLDAIVESVDEVFSA